MKFLKGMWREHTCICLGILTILLGEIFSWDRMFMGSLSIGFIVASFYEKLHDILYELKRERQQNFVIRFDANALREQLNKEQNERN